MKREQLCWFLESHFAYQTDNFFFLFLSGNRDLWIFAQRPANKACLVLVRFCHQQRVTAQPRLICVKTGLDCSFVDKFGLTRMRPPARSINLKKCIHAVVCFTSCGSYFQSKTKSLRHFIFQTKKGGGGLYKVSRQEEQTHQFEVFVFRIPLVFFFVCFCHIFLLKIYIPYMQIYMSQ